MKPLGLTFAIAFFAAISFAQMPDCPMHADGSMEHGKDVDKRHDTLGVTHDSTHHAFRLFDDGAAIELRANSESDNPTVQAIRKHMHAIADQFKANDFSTPMFVHDKEPDGVATIKQLHSAIDFRYEELPAGARVRMHSANSDAVDALHRFMKFQIVEHRTGDSGVVEKDSR